MTETNIDWVEFYMAFADELLKYKDNRQELYEKIKKLPAFNSDGYLKKFDPPTIDIDPFTIFGIFNKGKYSNRFAILTTLEQIARDFSIDKPIPSNFSGCPLFLPLTFDVLSNEFAPLLWDLFEAAIKFADSDNQNKSDFIKYYDAVAGHKGMKWNLTMVLYWVRPLFYLSLDRKNRAFLRDPQNISFDFADKMKSFKNLPTGQEYIGICTDCKKEIERDSYSYKTFPELYASAWDASPLAKKEMDNMESVPDEKTGETQFWIYSPGEQAKFWNDYSRRGIMGIGWDEVGNLSLFSNREGINNRLTEIYGDETNHSNDILALWQFSHEIKIGDIVFAKKGSKTIIGRGIVKSLYRYDIKASENFRNIIEVDWKTPKKKCEISKSYIKTLTNISNNRTLIDEANEGFEIIHPVSPIIFDLYTQDQFLNDVYISEEMYDDIIEQLAAKKNIILQGAPGVGKTYMAKRLAYSIMGEMDTNRVMMIQFHQSYSYEDFVMGFRPQSHSDCSGLSFAVQEGVFYKFCKEAEDHPNDQYFFIIDEINRGNVSKIFGELFMLIESDKRTMPVQLLYRDETFSIPKNLYIIGMMNTADRSLAMIDYALRRRFSFISVEPGFQSQGFQDYQDSINNELFNNLIKTVVELNNEISDDEALGKGFCIGHSYFCGYKPDKIDAHKLRGIVKYELIPLLTEYWFDSPDKIQTWSNKLLKAVGE